MTALWYDRAMTALWYDRAMTALWYDMTALWYDRAGGHQLRGTCSGRRCRCSYWWQPTPESL